MDTLPAVKRSVRRIPGLGPTVGGAFQFVRRRTFPGSARYWERRYASGGTSGEGSAGKHAEFKAAVVNTLVSGAGIESVIEFGCGDGQQLALANYPRYLGLDVSVSTLRATAARFADDPTKSFMRYEPETFVDPAGWLTADLALSLDVIYHLVEDEVYDRHLQHLFGAARRLVVLFTSDLDSLPVREPVAPHVRHRSVVRDVQARFPAWRLRERIPNRYPYRPRFPGTSCADFFIYEPVSANNSTRR
jgi:SAM-dependent methyltransferase